MFNSIIKFFLENKVVTFLITILIIGWGMSNAPFSWSIDLIPHNPVPVDAIPDIGDNQQIVYAEWPGRSPQDIEDQITYPLTTALIGIPGVKSIRSNSIFGLSNIYIIFDEDVEFYWSRSRILEKLNSLPAETLPGDVQPALGPDATALGQIFWYTLEGRDDQGNPSGGWDPQELRTIQDFYIKYSLASVSGVAEVASIGGFVKEYQVDIDPVAMKGYNVNIQDIMNAVRKSNLDVGARTIEFNKAEYLIRGLGYVKSINDIEESVVVARNNIAVRIKDVARVQIGPAPRRGGLDKAGAEAVGAVVVARYGSNPMDVISDVKSKIAELTPGLPSKKLSDGTNSKLTIVPFYDRSGLIKQTIGTLEEALSLEILISIIVVIILVLNLRASLIIASILPLGVLITFTAMRYTGVSANIVALSGIAIAIGVMVDVGVVITENILRHLKLNQESTEKKSSTLSIVYKATTEVSPAVLTALATTIISFIPVFGLEAQEGKLFQPLAFTKSYALLAALFIGIVIIPAFAHWIFSISYGKERTRKLLNGTLIIAGIPLMFYLLWAGLVIVLIGINNLLKNSYAQWKAIHNYLNISVVGVLIAYFLTTQWLPLGAGNSTFTNLIFVGFIMAGILGLLFSIFKYYEHILTWCLQNQKLFLAIPIILVLFGAMTWIGHSSLFGFLSWGSSKLGYELNKTALWQKLDGAFPGIGEEFMPSLDEGSFLLMPTTMPHSGVEENISTIQLLDRSVYSIPEVESVVGKWGRVGSALDPAPISMFENVINYKSEYILDEDGHKRRFETIDPDEYLIDLKAWNKYWSHSNRDLKKWASKSDQVEQVTFQQSTQNFVLSYSAGTTKQMPIFSDISNNLPTLLIESEDGVYFRQWRNHIKSPDDIWNEVIESSTIPGMTSAPKLQPISTRLVMLSTGMRAPMGIKIYGPTLKAIEETGLQFEKILKSVPGIKPNSVFADRVVGKPYLEIRIRRTSIARYGLSIEDMQNHLGVAIGGNALTTTVEGRERYKVRVRYAREHRDDPDELKHILIPTPSGVQVPLQELADLQYVRGPQNIKSEDTFLVSYVIFDKEDGYPEVQVVENAQRHFDNMIQNGSLTLPGGVSYKFAGNYENQVRANKRLSILIPLSLMLIFMLLYLQFKKVLPTLMVFAGVFMAFAGGFIMIWLYGQEWFMDFSISDRNIRDVFNMSEMNLSVAVWVGFLALFGIATDDGVLIGTYLKNQFRNNHLTSVEEIRRSVIHAGLQRVRPAVITTATTLIALLPVLSSTGKGSDIMIPMAIPTFGGMLAQSITMFIVPVLYCMWKEKQLKMMNDAI